MLGVDSTSNLVAGKGTCAVGQTVACQIGSVNPFNDLLLPREYVTVTIVVAVGEQIADGTILTNTAAVNGSVVDPNPLNNTAQATTTVQSLATLQIAKVDLFDPVAPGGPLFYRVTVTNTGPSAAANLVVTDTLPGGVSFQSAGVDCAHDGSVSGGVITCTVGSLGVNARYEVLVTAIAPLGAVSGTVLSNTAATWADNAARVDDDAQTSVQQQLGLPVDLQITKTGPASVVAGEQVTYTIVITNRGPAIATGVDLKEILPAGVNLANVQSTQGLCFPSPLAALCQFGNIGVNQVVTVTVVGDVAAGVPAGTITNTAQVFADNTETAPIDNIGTATTTVTTASELRVSKRAIPSTAFPGEPLTYEILVVNNGPSDAANVVVTDTIPAGFVVVTTTATLGGVCTAGATEVSCVWSTLAAGATALVRVEGSVAASLTVALTNLVTLTSATPVTGSSVLTAMVTTPPGPQRRPGAGDAEHADGLRRREPRGDADRGEQRPIVRPEHGGDGDPGAQHDLQPWSDHIAEPAGTAAW